jgi:pyruvate carboxylase
MNTSMVSRDHSALLKHEEDLVKHEHEAAFKQAMDAKGTAKFIEELARKIRELITDFMVRVKNQLLLLYIGRLNRRSSKAASKSSRRLTTFSVACNPCNLLYKSCDPSG